MARAYRIHVPGQVWHLTHRCHRRQFLLKFARDRRLWRTWLYESRQRFGLCVLDYTVTSNHIHLVVRDRDQGEIAASMQLIEGCTGQADNRRKRRVGAFWADQYHATAMETGTHLASCVVYVDLNMVRAGVVRHPAEWEVGGYHDIQQQRLRYRIVDREALAEALGVGVPELAAVHREWVRCVTRGGSASGSGPRAWRWEVAPLLNRSNESSAVGGATVRSNRKARGTSCGKRPRPIGAIPLPKARPQDEHPPDFEAGLLVVSRSCGGATPRPVPHCAAWKLLGSIANFRREGSSSDGSRFLAAEVRTARNNRLLYARVSRLRPLC